MRLKGINYDVGRVIEGHQTRPTFDAQVVRREIAIIKNDLHCNAVKIQGQSIERVMATAEDALSQGLEVWLAPELFDKSQEATLDYTVKAAVEAERLRLYWPNLVLSIGTELTAFMQGIIEGRNSTERLRNPQLREQVKAGNKPLNAYLARAITAVRQVFHGNVTYASLARVEPVDWDLFDYVCVDLYRDKYCKDIYGDLARQYLAYHKPVFIGEFGCCTYRGAEDLGAMGWNIVDWRRIPPRLKGKYMYDQGVQARELADQLAILDMAGVDGAFVFTFVQPATMNGWGMFFMNLLTGFDPDIISYSLVKSYAGKHGSTYSNLTWDTKESFKAVADYYAAH